MGAEKGGYALVSVSTIEWAVAERALPGEIESGDHFVLAEVGHTTLAAVIDGLGHGVEAAHASREAARVLGEKPTLDLIELFDRCHRAIRATRGVVMSIARIDHTAGSLTWMGVGDTHAHLNLADGGTRRWEVLVQPGGVVGYQLPRLQPRHRPFLPGDTLIMTTDGIDTHSLGGVRLGATVRDIADTLLTTHAKPTDDALALVVRHRGAR